MITNVFARGLLLAGLLVTVVAQPKSTNCEGFAYTRYFSVATVADIKATLHEAVAGDLIEVIPGHYYFGNWDPLYDSFADPARGWSTNAPSTGSALMVFNKTGTDSNWITICGEHSAIIDGSDISKYNAYGAAIQDCQYVRLSGLTFQWFRKGVDVQRSKYIDVYNVHTQYTLQEGIRFRYNTVLSQARFCHIDQTGWMDKGNGEGIYIGTSKGNSVDVGDPADYSNNNHFFNNTFGLNITAENIDVKEFTTGGKIYNNTFEGYGVTGVNSAYSCVVLKGNAWEVFNNTCVGGRLSNFVGYRVTQLLKNWGNNNKIAYDECFRTPNSGYCAYIGSGTTGNAVTCLTRTETSCSICNCQSGTCGVTPSSPPPAKPPPPPSPPKGGGGGGKPKPTKLTATNTLADPTGKRVYLPNMQPTTGRREPIEDTFSQENPYRPFDD